MGVKNIMIVGVGGQGTLLTSRILGNLAIHAGFDVKLSEVHGMAQRGGSVVTFVRYGEEVAEPIVEEGCADVLIAFEKLEATKKAVEMGAPKAFNVVVLGAAARYMGFEKEDWLKVIEATVPPKTVEVNRVAFEAGYGMEAC